MDFFFRLSSGARADPRPSVETMAGHDLQQNAIGAIDQDAQNMLHPQQKKTKDDERITINSEQITPA